MSRLRSLTISVCALVCGLFAGSLATATDSPLPKAWTLREALAKAHGSAPVNVVFRDGDEPGKAWKADAGPIESSTLAEIAGHYDYSVHRAGRVAYLMSDARPSPNDSDSMASFRDWISGRFPGGNPADAQRAIDRYSKAYDQQTRAFASGLPMGDTPLSSLRPDQQARALEIIRENRVEHNLRFLSGLIGSID